MVDKFVDDGVIVSTRGRSSLEDYNYTAHKAGTWEVIPLVVLIDGDSASASEIFAGAISDHHRGTIVGQRSYGKGSVQGIFPLASAGAGVRLTTAKFYSPSGAAISKVGVEPDIKPAHRVLKPTDEIAAASAAITDEVHKRRCGSSALRQPPRHHRWHRPDHGEVSRFRPARGLPSSRCFVESPRTRFWPHPRG